MDVSKFFAVSIAVLLLAGCGQVGPLYPASEQSKTVHQYDQFLLQPSHSDDATATSVHPALNSPSVTNAMTNWVVLPYPFPKSSQP